MNQLDTQESQAETADSAKKSKNQTGIFLGKSGEIFGPFTDPQYQTLMTSGQIDNYSWIWDPGKDQWKPLEEPPPHPTMPKRIKKSTANWSDVQALCFDSTHLIQGRLSSVTQTGCQLHTRSKKATAFACGAAEMNLFDPTQDVCTSVPVQILAIEPLEQNQGWKLVIRWQQLPALN